MLKLTIFIGHFGSGKTEHAINEVLKRKSEFDDNVIVDLDVVNPFYRSSELKSVLEAEGVQVIAPNFAYTNMDLPSLPPEVQGVFSRENSHVVLDIGGDLDGAKVLGVYRKFIEDKPYELNFVYNTKRPFTNTSDKIADLIKAMEEQTKLKVTGLIANSHLCEYTDFDTIVEGIEVGIKVSKETNIPLVRVGVEELLLDQSIEQLAQESYPIDVIYRPLKIYLNKWYGRK